MSLNEMGSKYDSKQGVDGIATLTHDPIAVENIKKKTTEKAAVNIPKDKK